MSAIEEIIKWANGLPDWQGDAVRRLLEQGDLSAEDRDEIYQMAKVAAGLVNECVEPIAPKIGGFSGTSGALQAITLQRILDIEHVNAVQNGSTIPFGHDGITVIYGENGSGKSSYGRILKRACRARDSKEPILPNVFDSTETGPATATIRIAEAGIKDIDLPWVDGEPADVRLASVTFFDSKCARVIVDDNNEAIYIPFGCEVFDQLVRQIKYVRERLQAEKPNPVEPTSADIVTGTASDTFLKNAGRNTKSEVIDAAIEWSEKDEKNLTETIARIAQSLTQEAIKEARRLESIATRAGELSAAIEVAVKGVSNIVIERINSQLDEIKAAEKAATLAAQTNLQNEPLPAGTSNEWKILYEAAREFSIKVAYPNSKFPAVGPHDLCVLCQQELDDASRARLERFRKFMEDTSEQSLKAARGKLKSTKDELCALKIPRPTDYSNVLEELSEEERKKVERLLDHLVAERDRLRNVESGVEKSQAFPDQMDSLIALKTNLNAAAVQAKKDADPEALKLLTKIRDELSSRKGLNHIEKDIRKFVEQKAVEYKYEQCIRGLGTRSISAKSKEIISAGLTPQLRGDLKNELKKLHADHLPLSVNITGREGGARHQLTLTAAKKAKTSDILSEGELCVVAVAGFMAELGGAPVKSPIVLDDPVTSLDHQYSRHIAQRLVDAAKHRQVVVFTHNIAFLVELEKRCAGIPLTVHTVKRFGATPGKCLEGLPWEAMPVKDRLSLLDDMANEASQYHGVDDTTYNKEAAYVYDLLRATWEAFVEQNLLNATVRRHDTDVQTQRLMRVEILDEDCKRVDHGMSKCSEWMAGHDKSQALSVNRPVPQEIRADIKDLREFAKAIKGRHETVRQRRKSILEPQKAEFG